MQDSYGRETDDLRISLTQRCNLACVFCHMEGQPPSNLELTPEEIERCVAASVSVGIRRVKLTGGEPTLRPDIVGIVRRIAPYVEEVSMTTNGLMLERLAGQLKQAGLRRVNVSLPSAIPKTYHRLTGAPTLDRALRGLRAARDAGLSPLKINVVVLAGITENAEEMGAIHEVAQEVGAAIQFIEFEPVKGRVDLEIYEALHAELAGIDSEAARGALSKGINHLHNRPQYLVKDGGGPMLVEIVRPVNNPDFCSACHRIRLTSFGALKGCLMTNRHLVDLLPALRNGASAEELIPLFEEVIRTRRPFFTAEGTPRDASLLQVAGAPAQGTGPIPGPKPLFY